MRTLPVVLALFLLSACGPQAFQNTDITGSDFANDFALVDHQGRPRTLTDYRGKAVAIFFGFTQCPDVCPTTMTQMKGVKDALGEDGERFQVLFVTIDPERDTQELLSQYVPAFDSSFVGLRGDADATARTTKEYKVFAQKVPGKIPGSYTLDHSTATYLYDPQGRVRLYVRHGTGVGPIVHDLKLLLAGH